MKKNSNNFSSKSKTSNKNGPAADVVTSNNSKPPRRRGKQETTGVSAIGMNKRSSDMHNKLSSQTTSEKPSSVTTVTKTSPTKQKTLLVVMGQDCNGWYDIAQQHPGRNDILPAATATSSTTNTAASPATTFAWRQRADELVTNELALFTEHSKSNQTSDDRWVESTMTKGTMKDKVAAMSIIIANHPFHRLQTLDNLIALAGSASGSQQRVSQMAGEALTDLFINTLLPPDRMLIPLSQRPFHLYEQQQHFKSLSPRVLLLWRYEELLKQRFYTFMNTTITTWLNDPVELLKLFALKTAITLLIERSEGESVLLQMVVNKIGDPNKKVAAAAGHQLRRLLERHPAMSSVVAREVQQLAFRPHISSKTLYNCIIFLNQLRLVRNDTVSTSLPVSLVRTYFKLFEVAVTRGGEHTSTGGSTNKQQSNQPENSMSREIKSRLLCALLTGVNRARPFLPKSDQNMEEYVDSLYRISHQAPAAASTQALMLLFHLAVGTDNINKRQDRADNDSKRQDRFYRVLYSKLADSSMLIGRQVTMFFNLIFKAMKHDTKEIRVIAFAKRLLQTTMVHCSNGAAIVAGALFLISEVMKSKQQPSLLWNSVNQNIPTEFDSTAREPLFAFGSSSSSTTSDENGGSLWELSTLLFHFHPSVVKFSETIGNISYNSDPLQNFTLAPFLDRFAYRQPKTTTTEDRTADRFIQRKSNSDSVSSSAAVPLNDPSLLRISSNNVADEDKFFHRYFEERARRDEKKGIVRVTKPKNEDEFDSDGEDDDVEGIYKHERNQDANLDLDSDSEEEAFVTQLAERMINQHSGGMGNFDDEDPDMEGWSDDDEEAGDDKNRDMEDWVDGEDDDSSTNKDPLGDEDDSFVEGDINSSGSDDKEQLMDNPFGSKDDSSNGDSETEAVESPTTKKKKKTKERPSEGFEDADDYEEIIARSWAERDNMKKRKLITKEEQPTSSVKSAGGKKKGKNKKN